MTARPMISGLQSVLIKHGVRLALLFAVIVAAPACDDTGVVQLAGLGASASAGATLSGLALSSGSLTPGFASGTSSYSVSVPNATTVLTVTPTASANGSTITVNGVSVPSGTPSNAIALAVGQNTVTVVVTAPDGTAQTYTINVTRGTA
jgi:hypothetical protein